jgi:Retrotransposon gag protein
VNFFSSQAKFGSINPSITPPMVGTRKNSAKPTTSAQGTSETLDPSEIPETPEPAEDQEQEQGSQPGEDEEEIPDNLSLADVFAQLAQTQELLKAQNARLAAQDELIAELRRAPVTPGPDPDYSREPKVPLHPEFTGKVSEFRNFMAQCTLTFALCPKTYASDESKVLFVVSRFRDKAMTWARDIPENQTNKFRSNYAEFKKAITNLYLDRNQRDRDEDKLSRLTQTGSAAVYAVDFESLVASLDFNDEAKCSWFYKGLSSDVKDGIALVGRPKVFTELVNLAISIDQRLQQRKRDEKP